MALGILQFYLRGTMGLTVEGLRAGKMSLGFRDWGIEFRV